MAQRAQQGGLRRHQRRTVLYPADGIEPGDQPGGHGLDISLRPGDLPGQKQIRTPANVQRGIHKTGRADVGIAVHAAVSQEPGPLQPGNEPEDAPLLRLTQTRLTADHIIDAAPGIVLTKLNDGPWPLAGSGIVQPDRPQGPEQQRPGAPPGHLLDRQAGLEEEVFLKVMQRRRLGVHQLFIEVLILLSIEGAVQIGGSALAVSGGGEDLALVEAVGLDQRRDGIVEEEILLPQASGQVTGQGLGGQRTAGHHQRAPGRQPGDLPGDDPHQGMALQAFSDLPGKTVTIDGQRRSGRHGRSVGRLKDDRAQSAQLALEQSTGRIAGIRFQRIAADQLAQQSGPVSRGGTGGSHLAKIDGDSRPGYLPGRLAARQPASYDLRRSHRVHRKRGSRIILRLFRIHLPLAAEAAVERSLGFGVLFHQRFGAALGTGLIDRFVPGGVFTLGVLAASVE